MKTKRKTKQQYLIDQLKPHVRRLEEITRHVCEDVWHAAIAAQND